MGNDKMTINAMAKLCGTTVKTLRIYEREGLLAPSEVNPENRYRYYTSDQCATFDMVKGMQALGYSLDEIRELVACPDIDRLETSLAAHVQGIQEQIAVLHNRLGIGETMLRSCQEFRNHLTDGTIHVGRFPQRQIIRVGIHYEGLKDPTLDGEGQVRAWDAHVRELRKWIEDNGYPMTVFHNAGGIITREHLLQRAIYDDDSFVFAPPQCDPAQGMTEGIPPEMFDVMPAGTYVYRYERSIVGARGGNYFQHGVDQLLTYIEQHGWTVAGDYFGVVIAESEMSGYTSRDMLYKMCIPVKGPKASEVEAEPTEDDDEGSKNTYARLLDFLRHITRNSK